MGFDRAFAPGTRVDTALAALAADFAERDHGSAPTG
jgi:methylmalonyl-CoA mutase cobalamin-binding subunit